MRLSVRPIAILCGFTKGDMRMRHQTTTVLLAGLIIVVVLIAGGTLTTQVGASTGSSAQVGPTDPAQTGEIDPDRTQILIELQPDGDAHWQIDFRFELATEEDRTAFQNLTSDINANTVEYTGSFETRLETTAEGASNRTGRAMTIENVSLRATTERLTTEYGVVTYAFTWENFAEQDGDQLIAGDAIDGFVLTSETDLTVRWPDSYRASTTTPTPDQRSEQAVTWFGSETNFVAGQPRITVTAEADSGVSWVWLGAVLLGGLLLVGGWWLYRQQNTPAPAGSEPPTPDAETTDTESSTNETTESEPAAELLSNEEQVLQLLKKHGGRMKQQQIVSETGWTEAKTSQVITDMREADQLEVFRIGRENVIALPDETDI